MDDTTLSIMDAPRAVLDTSVLISYERHWLWSMAGLGFFDAVWSTFIVGEMVRIRVESSIARNVDRSAYRGRVNLLVHRLSDVLRLADYRSILLKGALSDPDDEPILATALAAGARFVVSNDVKHFPLGGTIMHVRFITPLDFLTVLDGYLINNSGGQVEISVRSPQYGVLARPKSLHIVCQYQGAA